MSSSTGSDFVAPRVTRASLLALFATLCVLWLLWSGHYTVDLSALFAAEGTGHEAAEHEAAGHEAAEHEVVNPMLLLLGLASCAGVALLCRGMGIVDNETIPLYLVPRLFRYAPWLAWQVVLANLEVIRRILHPTARDRPETVVVEGLQRSDVGLTSYANSITLTPGTITVDVTGRTFTVHALTPMAADGIYDGDMDREVARLEGLG